MEGRAEQEFGFAIMKATSPEEFAKSGFSKWKDPDTMEECNWLLARPTVFPILSSTSGLAPYSREAVTLETRTVCSRPPHSAVQEVFNIPELLDIILSAVVELLPRIAIYKEKSLFNVPVAPSLISTTRVLFGLLTVNRHIHRHILTSRQDLFLSLAWQHAWTLPCAPLDVCSWTQMNPSIPLSDLRPVLGSHIYFQYQPPSRDWRGYLLTFLRKEDPHVRNRWRMYRMAMQFALGKKTPGQENFKEWKWSCGDRGYIPMPYEEGTEEDWEVPPEDA